MTTNTSSKVVLCDKLYSIYKRSLSTDASRLKAQEIKKYEKLISNIELDVLTNLAQVQRCVAEQNLPQVILDDLQPSLIDSPTKAVGLIALAQETFFKLVITCNDANREPPFFNLTHSPIKKLYSITCLHDEPRTYLLNQLKVLMQNADKILICDKYFSQNHNNSNLFGLIPEKNLTIEYVQNAPDNGYKNSDIIQDNMKSGWSAHSNRDNRFQRSHDRYLIIDDRLEVMLSSGYDYLWNQSKEITCVFREII